MMREASELESEVEEGEVEEGGRKTAGELVGTN
jgi:hypothetical protein